MATTRARVVGLLGWVALCLVVGISPGCGGRSTVAQEANAGAANTLANGSTSATTSVGLGQGGATTILSANATLGGRATTAIGGVMQTSSSDATGGAWTSSNISVGGSAVGGAGGDARSMAGIAAVIEGASAECLQP